MSSNQNILGSARKTGFLGIIININSLKNMYIELKRDYSLSYIPTHKLSQDHIELFFGTIRSAGGYNNNPTVRQFRSAYTKILVHTELKESSRGNCVPLEHINILQGSKPVDNLQQINATSGKNRIAAAVDEIELFPSDVQYLEDRSFRTCQ
ncbi:hypothetical protein ILUMI_26470 [Ignelater luminosus]|uniref:Transposable element P transposase-like RNase H C-terminal domain-containing protein n=1 Tax=Ignelater luminosus TaxID=2038154 RepID=A0A8K0C5R0_IGNLU|nr:hypothetical protein ILUMI_26470 [Ignelater luminosus]